MEKDVDKVVERLVEIFVGIDVCKAWLDIAVHEQEETWRVGNADVGIANLVKRMKELKPALIVLEPTGGFEMLVVAELTHAGLPAVVVNAKRVRDFARATGRLAKTDKLDAKVLAHFAAAIRASVTQPEKRRRRATYSPFDPPQAGFGHVDGGKEPFSDRSSKNAYGHRDPYPVVIEQLEGA